MPCSELQCTENWIMTNASLKTNPPQKTDAPQNRNLKSVLARWGQRLLIVPPILISIGILVFVTSSRASPKVRTDGESARALSVIPAVELDVNPRVIGFGTAEYAKAWRAVSQVSGRILEIHPELRPGAIISADEVLLKIDDADYRSVAAELEASIEQKQAEIALLEQTSNNYDKTLVLERAELAVLEGELQRVESLVAREAESQSSIDAARRALIAQQQVVLELENSKSLIAPQVQALKASIRQTAAQLDKARRDVERTEIRAPFTMRIGDVDLELDQYVSTNETLFEGFSFSEVEIEVQVSMNDMPRLLAVPPEGHTPPEQLTMELMRDIFRVSPQVEILGGDSRAVYEGRFLRVREVVDAQTRQLGVVIGVTNRPQLKDGRPRPPLLEGSFCRVTLRGESIGPRVVVPRAALHGSTVYVVDADSRLAARDVTVEFLQGDVAVISSGLSVGELVIVADPSPAVEGMLIAPVEENELAVRLKEAVE